MANNSNGNGTGAVAGAALGVAALAAGAAGAFWLYGAKHSSKHRKLAKSYLLKARAEALEAVEKAKTIDKASYQAIVDKVVAKYSAVSGVTAEETAQLGKDLRAAWAHISAAVTPKGAKKAVKKAPAKKPASK